jgi:hypothetical protein
MPCAKCQQRREAIARIAREAGTIVFGGAKRVLAAPAPPPQSKGDDGKR